ncbi:MAG: dockerin type I domain-containing protein [Planctomycetota bacterium]
MHHRSVVRVALTGLLAGPWAVSAQAAFSTPSWDRPTSIGEATADGTTYQEWNTFSSVSGPNAPDVDEPFNPNGVANVFDSAAPGSASFIATSGNIYSFDGVIEPEATVPTTQATTEFLVQLRTQGSDIDVNDLTVNGEAATGLPGYSYTELDRVAAGGVFGGAIVDHAWTFTADPASLYTLEWGWGVTSASVDVLIIDTLALLVPGDYNADGVVDGADYTFWANRFGSTDPADLAADGNGDGVVDGADYTFWANRFGDSAALSLDEVGLGFPPVAVPEPASLALLLVGLGAFMRRRAMASSLVDVSKGTEEVA